MDTSPAEALEDLAVYDDLAAEVEGLRATYLTPMGTHPDSMVRQQVVTLEACLTAALNALDGLKSFAP